MNEAKRVYRKAEPSDLPGIQSGKLKVFRNGFKGSSYYPARIGSLCYVNPNSILMFYKKGEVEFCSILQDCVIDITPEKRYVIWSKTTQRFVDNSQYPPTADRQTQEDLIDKWVRNGSSSSRYTIVEFDYPGE